jgi:hypothetical protein
VARRARGNDVAPQGRDQRGASITTVCTREEIRNIAPSFLVPNHLLAR